VAPSRDIDFKLVGTLNHQEIIKNPARELKQRLAKRTALTSNATPESVSS
jgi:hypothetical protein